MPIYLHIIYLIICAILMSLYMIDMYRYYPYILMGYYIDIDLAFIYYT